MMTMDDALAMIDGFNAKYTALIPAGHLGVRVIDMENMVISQDVLVLDTPDNRAELEMFLVLAVVLPPQYLVLTNVA